MKQPDLPGTPPKPKRKTWVTPFAESLERKTGMPPNVKRLMRELKTVKDATGDNYEAQYPRWLLFLRSVEARYASPTYFRTTYHMWTPEALHRRRVDDTLDRDLKRREKANMGRLRGPERDTQAIGALIADMERYSREVPEWLRKAAEHD